jgi:glycosyltransferase 2 family protein
VKKFKVILIFVLGLVLFVLFLITIDYRQLWNAICHARWGWICACLASGFSGYFVRAYRWQYLLMPIKKIKPFKLFKATVIGFSVTIVFPGRLGEIVRPYLIGTWENISKSSAFATIIFERILDMLSILVYFAAYLFFFSDTSGASTLWSVVHKSGLVALVVGIAGFTILLLWGHKPQLIKRLISAVLFWSSARFRNKVLDIVESFSGGLAVLKSPWQLFKVIILSFVFWFTIVLATIFIIWAFVPDIAFVHGIFIMVLVVLGIAVPTPGGAGTFDWAVKWGLERLGIEPNLSATIALVYHVTTCAPVVLVGIAFMWQEGLRWDKIKQIK